MNFKIEIRYLNISNYPNIARYLEDKAKEG